MRTVKLITEDEEISFNINFSNNGMWGRAIYFAAKANYSIGYCANDTNGDKVMIVARVIVGKTIRKPSNNNIRKPDPGYDSVHHMPTYDNYTIYL